ncbi:phospholipase D-like domain-containing protein [Rhizobium sp. TRM95111]|uniref:phospholipase D-like domain-containing protein n=1 Tax=Rhizobium alarense TaxID=2846851 RepID=UPI001F1C4257|nr:phospholipase D-like domain-containing protein [Rhizobium alarense]MCF3638863.1 phospholipase D-like domain-containing protein [Rhizobium alarense]
MPPSPSRLESVLVSTPAARLLTLTDTADAFRHLAVKARDRLIVMTPYLDAVGSAWILDMFEHTSAPERILIVQSAEQLARPGIDIQQLRERATRICCYGGGETDETFHAKMVLADGSHAYVGSANFLSRSKMANLECGLMVEGPVVTSIATLMEAVLETFDLD